MLGFGMGAWQIEYRHIRRGKAFRLVGLDWLCGPADEEAPDA